MATPLISYETASVEDHEARANRAWLINEEGEFLQRKNSADAVRPQGDLRYWYQTPFAAKSSKNLTPEALGELRTYLSSLASLPPRTVKESEGMQGGAWYRLRVFLPDGTRELEVDSNYREDIDTLLKPVFKALSGRTL